MSTSEERRGEAIIHCPHQHRSDPGSLRSFPETGRQLEYTGAFGPSRCDITIAPTHLFSVFALYLIFLLCFVLVVYSSRLCCLTTGDSSPEWVQPATEGDRLCLMGYVWYFVAFCISLGFLVFSRIFGRNTHHEYQEKILVALGGPDVPNPRTAKFPTFGLRMQSSIRFGNHIQLRLQYTLMNFLII
jgi:hypothetical protein